MARVEEILKDTTTKIRSLAGNLLGLDVYGESHRSPNLIPFPYYHSSRTNNGVTWTVNEDGSITANGTATANSQFSCASRLTLNFYLKPGKYIFNGCPSGGSTTTYRIMLQGTSASGGAETLLNEYGTGATINIDEVSAARAKQIILQVNSGQTVNNLVFKPMVQKIIVGKNKIPYPYYSPNSWEQNGITYTVNPDYTVTANGKATAVSRFYFYTSTSISFAGNKVRLSGCPSGGSNRTYAIYTQGNNQFDYGDGCVFDYTSDMSGLAIVVYNGNTVNNLTFKPMLEIVDESVPLPPIEYEPYKETYQEEYEKFGIHPTKSIVKTSSANLIPLPYFDRWSSVDNEEGEFGGSLDDNFVDHGVNFTELSGGLMSALGTATNGTATARLVSESQKINIGHGKKFVLSGGINIDKYIGLHFYKEGALLPFKSYYSYGKPTLIEDMVDEEYERVQIQVYVADGTYANDVFYPMIVEVQEDGSYPTVFEPHKTSQMDLSKLKDRNNNPCDLYSIGEYKNQISIGRYSGTYIRNVRLVDMGDLNYIYQSSTNTFLANLPSRIHTTDRENAGYFSMSQYYTYSTAREESMEDKSYTYTSGDMFGFKNTTYTDVDSFKAAMKGIQFLYVPQTPDSVGITNLTEVQKLETYTPYTYVTSTIDIALKYNWYEWQTPKVDWVSSDYFNFEDYIRIGSNIDAVYDFSLSMYPDYEHTTPDYRIDYMTIPYAATWNVINDNLYAINQNTVKLDIGTKNIYYDNGKTPNYEEFNKWEYTTAQLMEELRRKARTLPRLSMVLGRKTIGSRY